MRSRAGRWFLFVRVAPFGGYGYAAGVFLTCAIPRFDPRVHITAGQLRRLRFYLAENVPDGAYVRRAAVGLDDREDLEDGTSGLGLEVLEPFDLDLLVRA